MRYQPFVATESITDFDNAGLRIGFELNVTAPETETLCGHAAQRLAPAFPDLVPGARLIAPANDPSHAILRLTIDALADDKTRLTLTSAQRVLTPFDWALVCRALLDATLGRQGPAFSSTQDVAIGATPDLAHADFGYPDAAGARTTCSIATSLDPKALATAVAQVVAVWAGHDRPALAVLAGNGTARASLTACAPDGTIIPMRGVAHRADFLFCVQTPGDNSDALFRAALLGGRATTADVRVVFHGAALERSGAALTLLAHEGTKCTELTLLSGRRGFPAPIADWFLQDLAAVLSGIAPQDRESLPSIRNRRDAQGPARKAMAQIPAEIKTLWQGIEATCRAHPERIALDDGIHNTAYATLHAQALATAPLFNGDDRPVGLLFDHGPAMVSAMLAALSAGRAYVPLDPEYPQARLAYMLAASGASMLLSDAANAVLARRIAPEGCAIVPPDATTATTALAGGRVTSLDDAAYILFTSGSTGTPKRVVQSHRNVLLQVRNHVAALSITDRDRVSVVSSFCFDASVTDTYGALLTGATLVLASARRKGLMQVAQTIQALRVTVWHSTPTAFRHMVQALGTERALPDLRAVILGGEPVFAGDVHTAARHCAPGALFVNGYGATEASFITQNPVTATNYKGGDIVPIGWPIPAFEVDLVDTNGQPTPVMGEMIVTTAHFAAEDNAPNTSDRHATKDLARFDPRTGFSYLGRSGQQIKLRGYRVDLAEIEQVLARQPGVANVCVTIRPDPRQPDTEALCAWLAVVGAPPRKSALACAVRAKLPAYMVPTYYTLLPALPLTQSGKIDRTRMPEPDTQPDADPGATQHQSTPLNDALSMLFGLVRYDPQASFFDLGLTSLSIARLHAHLAVHSGTTLSLIDFFDLGTPTKVASRLTATSITDQTADKTVDDTVASVRARLAKRKRKRAGR